MQLLTRLPAEHTVDGKCGRLSSGYIAIKIQFEYFEREQTFSISILAQVTQFQTNFHSAPLSTCEPISWECAKRRHIGDTHNAVWSTYTFIFL